MTLATMTRQSLFGVGAEPPVDDTVDQEVLVGRFKVGPRMPSDTLKKTGLKVHQEIPEDWNPEQLTRWKRRGLILPIRDDAPENTQAGEDRETTEAAAPPPSGDQLSLADLEKRGSWYYFPDGTKALGKAKAEARLAELNG